MRRRSWMVVLLLVVIVVFCSVFATACEKKQSTKKDVSYQLKDNGTYRVSKFSGGVNTLEIPLRYKDKVVTEIGAYVFFDCTELKNLIIPKGVSYIGEKAFDGCNFDSLSIPYELMPQVRDCTVKKLVLTTAPSVLDREWIRGERYYFEMDEDVLSVYRNVEHLVLPEGVTKIQARALDVFENLISITLPSSLKSTEADSFHDLTSLFRVFYSGDIGSWCKINFDEYYGQPMMNAYELYIGNKLVTDIIIPDWVEGISDYAFYNYHTEIDGRLFIPKSVQWIGRYAFCYCHSITEIEYGGTVKQWNDITLGEYWGYSLGTRTVICSDGRVTI